MNIEIRSKCEAVISGYVNAVERRSAVLSRAHCKNAPDDFVEVIKSGAFARSLKRQPDVKLKFNHERDLGGTGDNLELREDNIGLYASAEITDPEVVTAAREGRLTGWSFAFVNPKDSWETQDKICLRSITDMDLLEVSILTKRPAYPATSVEVRDGEQCELRAFDDPSDIKDLIPRNETVIELRNRELEILNRKGIVFYEP